MMPANESPSMAGWVRRHKLLAAGMGCFGLIVAGCLLLAGLLVVASVALRSSDAYQLALSTATHHPQVVAELGAPVQAGWVTTGSVSVSGATGEASLAIPISGLRSSGTIKASAHKSAGTWAFSVLTVDIASRATPIDLLATP